MARLLIGVSGGIAAYKAIETARLAIRAGHAVRIIQSSASTRFVGSDSFAAITGAPVLSDEFDPDPLRGSYPGDPLPERAPISHLALVQRADAYLLAPATANEIAKLASGHADSLLATAALAAGAPGMPGTVPVLVAPAMNDRMYAHPATQANLRTLRDRGVTIVGPGTGELASHGERGVGRMSEPAELLAAVEAVLARRPGAPPPDARDRARAAGDLPSDPDSRPEASPWHGRRVIVTAGGTREPIDAVRFIGNRSSGRMGYALAERALARGAEVTLIAANVSLPTPVGARLIAVMTAAELQAACETDFDACDALVMAAAVADFRPRDPVAHKLKKTGPDPAPLTLALESTTDILAALAGRRDGQLLVGFAAEHGPGALAYGEDKLARKGLDAIVVNDVASPEIGFDAVDNEVTVLTVDGGRTTLARASKEQIADGILDRLEAILDRGGDEDVGGPRSDRTARV